MTKTSAPRTFSPISTNISPSEKRSTSRKTSARSLFSDLLDRSFDGFGISLMWIWLEQFGISFNVGF